MLLAFTLVFGSHYYCCTGFTHRLQSSSFLGLPYRVLNINHKKELLWSLWVRNDCFLELQAWNEVFSCSPRRPDQHSVWPTASRT